MRLMLTAFALFCLFRLSFAAPIPSDKKAKPEEKETGPIEIDFSPLLGTKDPTLLTTIHFENGTKIENLKSEISGTLNKSVQVVVTGLETSLDRFDVQAVGDSKLVIRGYKGKGVLKVECKVPGFAEENQPKDRRLKEEKKDKKDKK